MKRCAPGTQRRRIPLGATQRGHASRSRNPGHVATLTNTAFPHEFLVGPALLEGRIVVCNTGDLVRASTGKDAVAVAATRDDVAPVCGVDGQIEVRVGAERELGTDVLVAGSRRLRGCERFIRQASVVGISFAVSQAAASDEEIISAATPDLVVAFPTWRRVTRSNGRLPRIHFSRSPARFRCARHVRGKLVYAVYAPNPFGGGLEEVSLVILHRKQIA